MRSATAKILLGLKWSFEGGIVPIVGFIHILFYYIVSKATKLMSHYSISFQLLLPKTILFRLDILPFLLAYTIMGYYLYEFYEDENLNLYLRLSLIGTAFLNCKSSSIKVSHT